MRFYVTPISRETPFLEGYEINADNPYLKNLSEAVNKTTGNKAIPYFRSSVANEWVSLSSLDTLSKILKHFVINS